MLVLTIKQGEPLYIGDNIKVTILETNGRQSRVGIEAPKDVAVDRQVIRERKLRGDKHGPV